MRKNSSIATPRSDIVLMELLSHVSLIRMVLMVLAGMLLALLV
jgi:hypothetical protein